MPRPTDWYVIVNPASGGGRAGRRWPSLARALDAAGVPYRSAITTHPGHAVTLAAEAIHAGYRRVLSVGGDGVLHESLNGIMGQDRVPPREICLGAAPLGSGNDWARAQAIPSGSRATARCVAACRTRLQDVGRLEFPAATPGTAGCYFINVAGAGIDAHVLQRLPAHVPRKLAYVLGVLRSLSSFVAPSFEVEHDGSLDREQLLLALVALGPYCGGGMRLVPHAVTDDGHMDLLKVGPLRLPRELLKLRRLFDGRLAEERFATHRRVTRVAVNAHPAAGVQADGQLVGSTPFVATILPAAIRSLHG